MTVAELMKDITPNEAYADFCLNKDFVLAFDLGSTENAAVDTYAVVSQGINDRSANLNPEEEENDYFHIGKWTTRTGVGRTFEFSGHYHAGDPLQKHLMSHDFKFGLGNKIELPYVYFNMFTGKGEKGTAMVSVQSDGGGAPSEKAAISIKASAQGTPAEYTYTKGA